MLIVGLVAESILSSFWPPLPPPHTQCCLTACTLYWVM